MFSKDFGGVEKECFLKKYDLEEEMPILLLCKMDEVEHLKFFMGENITGLNSINYKYNFSIINSAINEIIEVQGEGKQFIFNSGKPLQQSHFHTKYLHNREKMITFVE